MPKVCRKEVDLGKEIPAIVGVDTYRNEEYIYAREMYIDRSTNETKFGKNGINIKFDYALRLILALIDAFNQATDRQLILVMEDGTPYTDEDPT